MNAARMGVLVLAVVAAGLAALLARSLMAPSTEETAPQVAEVQSVEVLVAATNIERGRRLGSGDMRWQKWPSGSTNADFITRSQNPDAASTMTNMLARQAIANGEPVMPSKLIDPQKGGLMSALIGPGMRAVAVPISPETSAGGFILPNDHVDVILTRRARERTESGPQEVIRGETILANVRVLAVDQSFQTAGSDSVAVGKTATLELSAPQAEALSVAQAQGTVILSLRGLNETAEKPREAEGGIVSVVRYGSEKTVRVK